jgi:hypothetical protein
MINVNLLLKSERRKEKMKTKLFSMLIVAMLTLGMIAFAIPVKALTGNEYMIADPATKTLGPTPPPIGTEYNFTIRVGNMTRMTTLAASLSWDPTKVNVTKLVMGQALPGSGMLIGGWDKDAGFISDITVGVLGTYYDIAEGTYLFVYVKALDFTGPGGTVIDIQLMSCWDFDLNKVLDGDCLNDHTVYILMPPPTNPTVDFSWIPFMPQSGVDVTFTAVGTPGFDGTQMCPITNYYFDWENDGVIDLDNGADPVAHHTFALDGTYTVNVTVYAPPGLTPDPSYYAYASMTHDVLVQAPPTGRSIDLFTCEERYPGYITPFTGKDYFGGQVDSYAPQDLVCLCAKVTYNNEPVVNKEVVFEIRGPVNPYHNVTVMRQASTNESGIACITFRIPWPYPYSEESIFGNWSVMARVSIGNVEVMDSHWFLVGWIIDVVDILLYDSMSVPTHIFQENTYVFINTTVHNIAMTPRNVTLGIVIYDELDVPIGAVYATYYNVPPGETELDKLPILVLIYIPEWAYVGMGTVYDNAFTTLPAEGGICWCPEHNTWIKITPDPAGP